MRWFLPIAVVVLLDVGRAEGSEMTRAMHQILERARICVIESKADAPAAARYAATLDEQGHWSDCDFGDQAQGSTWGPGIHLRRIAVLVASAAQDHSAEEARRAWRAAARRALAPLVAARPQAGGWWWNEIGLPLAARDVAVVLGEELTQAERDGLLAILAQTPLGREGTNLTWTAELVLHRACLTLVAEDLERARAAIIGTLQAGQEQGIQSDWSFQLHGERLQQLHYGMSFVDTCAAIAWQLADGPWALPVERVAVLARLLLDGHDWFLRQGWVVPTAQDRACSRPGWQRVGPTVALAAERLGRCALPGELVGRLQDFAARHRGAPGAMPLVGARAFPDSEVLAVHRPDWMLVWKGIRERQPPPEVGLNGDLLQGWWLGYGDHYLLRHVDAYAAILPVLDWQRLPGVVVGERERPKWQRSSQVGQLAHDGLGIASQYFNDKRFHVRSSCFILDDEVLVLGADCADARRVTIDQCLQRETVRCLDADGEPGAAVAVDASVSLPEGAWIAHAGVAYQCLDGGPLRVAVDQRQGSWRRINSNFSAEPVSAPVLLLELDLSDRQRFAYRLVPRADRPGWSPAAVAGRVIANDADRQVVHCSDGRVLAVFHRAGAIEIGDRRIAVDQPCLCLLGDEQVAIARLQPKAGPVGISDGIRRAEAVTTGDGRTVVVAWRAVAAP